jgi:hypothetical protein
LSTDEKADFDSRFPKREKRPDPEISYCLSMPCISSPEMGLAPGGRMRQEIESDPFDLDDWDLVNKSRCFVHISNTMVWRALMGEMPPTVPLTAKEYNNYGLPWFEYFNDAAQPLSGSGKLKSLKSVAELGLIKGDIPLPENETLVVHKVVKIPSGLKKNQVREGRF